MRTAVKRLAPKGSHVRLALSCHMTGQTLSLCEPQLPTSSNWRTKYSVPVNHEWRHSSILPVSKLWISGAGAFQGTLGLMGSFFSLGSPFCLCRFSTIASSLPHWDTKEAAGDWTEVHRQRCTGQCGEALLCPPPEQPSWGYAPALRTQMCWHPAALMFSNLQETSK